MEASGPNAQVGTAPEDSRDCWSRVWSTQARSVWSEKVPNLYPELASWAQMSEFSKEETGLPRRASLSNCCTQEGNSLF